MSVWVGGEEWVRLRDVGVVVPGVKASTVRVWVSRNLVRKVRLGGQAWVAVADVVAQDARAARRWRRR